MSNPHFCLYSSEHISHSTNLSFFHLCYMETKDDDHEYKDEGARMQTRKRMDNRSHEDRKEKRRKEDAKH